MRWIVTHPKLRNLDAQVALRDGNPVFYLRDPLSLSEQAVAVPQVLGPVLALLDGSRDAGDVAAEVEARYGLEIGRDAVVRIVDTLDRLYLLDNERAAQATQAATLRYRESDFRAPFHAGQTYPADPRALSSLFDGFLAAVDGDPDDRGSEPSASSHLHARGVVSPHIDYVRGGLTYARVWARAGEAARAAELVVLVGTDHFGRRGSITLSHPPYATPWGVLPQPPSVVEQLAVAIGSGEAYADELHHLTEHSVELSANWLHHSRRGEPVATVPVLVGSYDGFVDGPTEHVADADRHEGAAPSSARQGGDPAAAQRANGFVGALREVMRDRRVLLVASVDLSHVGPAFGGEPVDAVGRERLLASDRALLDRVTAGDTEGFVSALRDGADTNVCGSGPLYLVLRALGETSGDDVDYQVCPADDADSSVVTISGMLLR